MARQQNPEQNDTFGALVLGAIAFILIALLLWTSKHTQISIFLMSVKGWQMSFLGLFSQEHADFAREIFNLPANRMTLSALGTLLETAGKEMRWIYTGTLSVLAIYLFFTSPTPQFRKRHTLKTLAQQEEKLWPVIAPVTGLDLLDDKHWKDNWRPSETEREFVRRYKLLDENKALRKDATLDVFRKQLGPLWGGPENLPPHQRAVFTIIALALIGERDDAEARIAQVAKSSRGTLDTSWVENDLKRVIGHELVREAIRRHAYSYTIIASMLNASRTLGVLASSSFLWLKPMDRTFWYVINNVGRYAFHVEAAGPMAHWLAERQLESALTMPYLDEAVAGLEQALREYIDEAPMARFYN